MRKAGRRVAVVGTVGKTPGQRMYSAVGAGDAQQVRRILAEHPEQLTECPGMSPSWLHYAARKGHRSVIDVFLEAGLEVDYRQRADGDTPLMSAVSYGQYETAKYLLSLKADPNAGRMLIAAINADSNSFELVKLLVKHGANVNQTWRLGEKDDGPLMNALSWALDAEKHEIADYLRSHGAVLPEAEPPKAPQTVSEEVIAYFRDHVGPVKPQALVEIVPTDVPIAVHVVPPTASSNQLTLFTTGMSEKPMTVLANGQQFKFAELVIHLPADWPIDGKALREPRYRWPIDWLRKIAAYPHQENTSLGGPVTIISNGDPPKRLAPGCPFTAMLLVADYENLGPVQAREGRTIHLYALMPLYPEERNLELSRGLPELFRRLDEHGISKVVNLKRPNVGPG